MGIVEHLVLLPGMMCDGRLWAEQIDGLKDFCASITVADITSADSIETIAQSVLEKVPDQFALAGLSMGGIVAFEIWRQASERVSRLALLDSNAHAELSESGRQRDQLLRRALAGEFREVITDALKPVYLAEVNKQNIALLDIILSMALDLGTDVFERQCNALKNRRESESTLPTITVPTLVLCGAEDSLCPIEIHEQMAQALPKSKLVVIEKCGHLSTMEQPDRVIAEMLEWLKAA